MSVINLSIRRRLTDDNFPLALKNLQRLQLSPSARGFHTKTECVCVCVAAECALPRVSKWCTPRQYGEFVISEKPRSRANTERADTINLSRDMSAGLAAAATSPAHIRMCATRAQPKPAYAITPNTDTISAPNMPSYFVFGFARTFTPYVCVCVCICLRWWWLCDGKFTISHRT